MKSFAALSAAVGLASIAGRASAIYTFTSSAITDKFDDVVQSNGLLGLKNVNVMLYENDFKGILGSYNGTFPINAAVALHFMGFLGAVWLYTLLPDRIQNGFANILAGRRPSLFSYGYSRYGQSSDYPDPDFLEYNLDYNPYDTPRVSESRRRLRRRRRKFGRSGPIRRSDQAGSGLLTPSDGDGDGTHGIFDNLSHLLSKRQAPSPYPIQRSSSPYPPKHKLTWPEKLWNLLARPVRLMKRAYAAVYRRYDTFWNRNGNQYPLISPINPKKALLKHLKNASHYGANRREDKVAEALAAAPSPQQTPSASEVATEVVELQPPVIPEQEV